MIMMKSAAVPVILLNGTEKIYVPYDKRNRRYMDRNKNKNKKCALPLLFVMISLLMTGCGKGTTNIDKGMQAIESLDYKEALTDFKAADKAGENKRLILRGEGIADMGLSDYDGAVEAFTGALGMNYLLPQAIDYDMDYYLAAAYDKAGKPDKAIGVYNAIISVRPGEADAFYLRGCVELSQDNYNGARADFDRAVDLNSTDYERARDIYDALLSHGYGDAGKEILQKVLDKHSSTMTDFDLGCIYYDMGQYDKAKEHLETANKRSPNVDTAMYLAKTYEASGDYDYAMSILDGYLTKDKNSASIYNELGLCEMKAGQYDDALTSFRSGLAAKDANSIMQTLKYNEICACEYGQDYEGACKLMKKYLAVYPDDEDAKREYSFLKTR